VVIAAISQQHSSLALGNILGSSISNILGAFSLGLIFSPTDVVFDRSAKIYTTLLLALTTAFVIYLPFFEVFGRFGGVVLVATFVGYFISIGYCIYKGVVSPPEDDDSDSDSDSDDDGDSDSDSDNEDAHEKPKQPRSPRSSSSTEYDEEAAQEEMLPTSNDAGIPLKPLKHQSLQVQRRQPRTLTSHILQLVLGFLALSLSGYLLSHSISSLASAFSLSDSVVGITILSFATTLPEKLVAVVGGAKKQSGIVVANTAGSNVFLLTLCAGVLFLTGDLNALKGEVRAFDVLALWGSSLLLFAIVVMGGRRWMGWVLLGLYIVFIGVEFVVYGRWNGD
jgi:Ca2+/Na+ antiporter